MRSYTIWRRYQLQCLVGQSATGQEILPDIRVIEQMLEDVKTSSHSPLCEGDSLVEAFTNVLDRPSESLARVRLDMALEKTVFMTPLTGKPVLCDELRFQDYHIPNPFSISPGVAYLKPKIDLDIRSLSQSSEGFELKMRPKISIPGLLLPKKPRLEAVCESLVDLVTSDLEEVPSNSLREVKAFLSKNGIKPTNLVDNALYADLSFALQAMVEELVWLSTKPYINTSGEELEYCFLGDDEVGVAR